MSVKLGYLLPTRENIMRGNHETRALIDRAKHAADLGYDSAWIGDSLFARPRHDPLALLAAVASVVPNIELGTAVLLPALRNPVILAQQLATIDQISEGRLIIGAGIAADAPSVRAEFEAAGVPFEKRVGRLMEGFALCRALWSGEEVSWDGRWKVAPCTMAPVPYRKGGPPIWLASGVEAGIKRAAEHFDGWFPIGPNPEVFGTNNQMFRQAAQDCDRRLDDMTTAIYLTVALGSDAEAANSAIDTYLEGYYSVPAKVMRNFQSCCGGTPEQVLTFLRSYVNAGADHIVLRLVGDHADTLRQIAQHKHELI